MKITPSNIDKSHLIIFRKRLEIQRFTNSCLNFETQNILGFFELHICYAGSGFIILYICSILYCIFKIIFDLHVLTGFFSI